jgi:uncharacterized membrane protein
VEVLVAALLGLAAAVPIMLLSSVSLGMLIGWDLTALVYVTRLWIDLRRLDATGTAERATVIDPDRAVADVLLLSAAVASLIAVALVLVRAGHTQGTAELLRIGLGLVSVVVSWILVHTIFTLRYAHLYYIGEDGGVDFNQAELPAYVDFGYLAFTIGMTFQVSDTPLQSRAIRRTALRHALLSYLFGTGILATTINLVASLSSR